jgi:hypothetical protein
MTPPRCAPTHGAPAGPGLPPGRAPPVSCARCHTRSAHRVSMAPLAASAPPPTPPAVESVPNRSDGWTAADLEHAGWLVCNALHRTHAHEREPVPELQLGRSCEGDRLDQLVRGEPRATSPSIPLLGGGPVAEAAKKVLVTERARPLAVSAWPRTRAPGPDAGGGGRTEVGHRPAGCALRLDLLRQATVSARCGRPA